MSSPHNYFNELADFLTSQLQASEIFTAWQQSETSQFVRFNKSTIGQAGTVNQRFLNLALIKGQKQIQASTSLSGERLQDQQKLLHILDKLRSNIQDIPNDPHLLYSTECINSVHEQRNRLPEAQHAIEEITKNSLGVDMVGIYAQGTMERAFANSLGQRNWYSVANYNFDWSLHHQNDKAVKCALAGTTWEPNKLKHKFVTARRQLTAMSRSPKTIQPGKYNVYLSPSAIHEIISLLSWSSFSRRAQENKQSPLLKLQQEQATLHPGVTIVENTKEGIGPNFQPAGFIKPPQVTLIKAGKHHTALTNPRSSKEYGFPTNGANINESPESLDMHAGDLPQESVLQELGTGIYVSDLWYLNFSDPTSCRITGMTRFATFWVENGQLVAPLNVMRFDDSLFTALGSQLVKLTKDKELFLSTDTYHNRSCSSASLPGALIEELAFTL